MKKHNRITAVLSLLLAFMFVFAACAQTVPDATTGAATTSGTVSEAPGPRDIVIAEKGKPSDFSLVSATGSDEAKKLADSYKEKLGVEFALRADTESASGNEIILGSDAREDCKALAATLEGGEYAIKAVKNDNGVTVLVAYRGQLAADAAINYLIGVINDTDGKAVIAEDLDIRSSAVTLHKDKDKNVIDVYLIGGQSNAAGSSRVKNLRGNFTNIMFTGEVDKNRRTGAASLALIGRYRKSVRTGYGVSTNHIGPEYGMAETLNDYYGNGRPAIIFKSAAGGTALHNDTGGLSDTFGNWYPRSMWGSKKVDPKTSPMGVQYYNFVENFRTTYNKLVEDGYTPKIRGMAWMQGESDLGRESGYEGLLKALINDLRADLYEITGDEDVKEMPFVIGKIATTFGSYNNPNVPSFNRMQERVARTMKNVYTIETADLIIVNKDGTVAGTDTAHFSESDAETLGIRFAEKLLEFYTVKE